MKRNPQDDDGASDSKRVMQTPRNTSHQLGGQMAYPAIKEDIKDLLGASSLEETQMTASDVWRRMSSRNAKLTKEEQELLVKEFNAVEMFHLDLPDASPHPLSQRARNRRINQSMEDSGDTLMKVEVQLKEIAAAQKLSGNTGEESGNTL